jgi:hypothetical protein
MTGYRTRWACPPEQPEDPERIAIREALAFGKAVYDSLARRASASPACPGARTSAFSIVACDDYAIFPAVLMGNQAG